MLRRILDNMTDMVNQTDTQGIFTYITPSYLSILGYQREELIGHSVFELIHPDDLEGVVDAFVKAGESLQPDKVEYRYRHADGNYLWLETSGNPCSTKPASSSGLFSQPGMSPAGGLPRMPCARAKRSSGRSPTSR